VRASASASARRERARECVRALSFFLRAGERESKGASVSLREAESSVKVGEDYDWYVT